MQHRMQPVGELIERSVYIDPFVMRMLFRQLWLFAVRPAEKDNHCDILSVVAGEMMYVDG